MLEQISEKEAHLRGRTIIVKYKKNGEDDLTVSMTDYSAGEDMIDTMSREDTPNPGSIIDVIVTNQRMTKSGMYQRINEEARRLGIKRFAIKEES